VGTLVPVFLQITNHQLPITNNYCWGYLVTVLSLLSVFLIAHIKRHTGSVEQCFQVALFLGVASYWLPTVVFLILPIWGWLIFQQQFSFRSFLSTLIGLSVVAVWAGIFICLGWLDNPWAEFFAPKNAWGWIPTGAFIVAFIASTIVRRTLRVR